MILFWKSENYPILILKKLMIIFSFDIVMKGNLLKELHIS